MDQSEDLLELLQHIKNKTELSVILWTGYTRKELEQRKLVERLVELVDVIIIGPYIEEFHEPIGLRGSSNQEYLFFSNIYDEQDLLHVPSAEIIFVKGEIQITGIDTEQVRNWFK